MGPGSSTIPLLLPVFLPLPILLALTLSLSLAAQVGLHGMHAEVDAFTVAGLSLRGGGGGGEATGGDASSSVRQLSAAMATLPSELPRHAHALRAQIAAKKKEVGRDALLTPTDLRLRLTNSHSCPLAPCRLPPYLSTHPLPPPLTLPGGGTQARRPQDRGGGALP